jgi:hypothetical protein
VLLGDLAFAHGSWLQRVTNQKAGTLIKTHHRIGLVIGQGGACQDLLKAGKKGRINRADAPGLAPMGL